MDSIFNRTKNAICKDNYNKFIYIDKLIKNAINSGLDGVATGVDVYSEPANISTSEIDIKIVVRCKC